MDYCTCTVNVWASLCINMALWYIPSILFAIFQFFSSWSHLQTNILYKKIVVLLYEASPFSRLQSIHSWRISIHLCQRSRHHLESCNNNIWWLFYLVFWYTRLLHILFWRQPEHVQTIYTLWHQLCTSVYGLLEPKGVHSPLSWS